MSIRTWVSNFFNCAEAAKAKGYREFTKRALLNEMRCRRMSIPGMENMTRAQLADQLARDDVRGEVVA